MKHNNKRQRKNQKIKRQSRGTNKGSKYVMTERGLLPRGIVERFN